MWPTIAAAIAAGAVQPALAQTPVTPERLLNAVAEPQNWLTTHLTYDSHRYSRLAQINRDNVGGLRVAFMVPLLDHASPTRLDIEGTPLVDTGMMYIADGWGRVYKIDVRSGRRGIILWMADSAIDQEAYQTRNRGVALWQNYVIAALTDGRVIAVDRDSGEIVWDRQVAVANEFGIYERFTAAPLAVEDRVLVAQSRGDSGTRGWLAALAGDGSGELWRTYTVPAPGEPGAETWLDDHDAWKTGGAALWTTGSYDPPTRRTIWGTANPVPMFDPQYRPGDNLFTNSAIAFDIDSGEMDWYFQYSPNESWDFDEQGVHMLYDVEIAGEMREVVGHFGRNGFYYQLDRATGEFINATQYVAEVNWTAGIDPKTGKPMEYDPDLALQTYVPDVRGLRERPPINVCPTFVGGVRWQPPAFDPETHTAYAVGADGCTQLTVDGAGPVVPGQGPGPGGAGVMTAYYGSLKAFDVAAGEIAAEAFFTYDIKSGVLATAGGLVFTAHQDGTVGAYSSDTLEELWSFNAGVMFKAPPMTYAVDGKQYIAILSGGTSDTLNPPGLENQSHLPFLIVFSL